MERGESAPDVMYPFPPTGAQVPITSYTCIQPNLVGFLNLGQCTVSNGLQYCGTEPVPFY